MDVCPVCKTPASIVQPKWSGGRMLVSCNCCGSFEISPTLYKELREIAEPHWQIDYIREGFSRITPPVKISRNSANTLEVRAVNARMTKLQKKLRRGKMRGTVVEVGFSLHYTSESEE